MRSNFKPFFTISYAKSIAPQGILFGWLDWYILYATTYVPNLVSRSVIASTLRPLPSYSILVLSSIYFLNATLIFVAFSVNEYPLTIWMKYFMILIGSSSHIVKLYTLLKPIWLHSILNTFRKWRTCVKPLVSKCLCSSLSFPFSHS